MRTLAVLAVLVFSAAAFGQNPHSTDVHCTTLDYLGETACTFGDASGEVISASSDTHFTAEEWGRMFPILIKADDDAKAEQLRKNTEAEARLNAENEKEIAAIKARAERQRNAFEFTANQDKKKCLKAGFQWAAVSHWKGECRVPEAK